MRSGNIALLSELIHYPDKNTGESICQSIVNFFKQTVICVQACINTKLFDCRSLLWTFFYSHECNRRLEVYWTCFLSSSCSDLDRFEKMTIFWTPFWIYFLYDLF
ncbi:hypothetical protein FGIG_08406 [Fasciola gigantica]|uniref:Uncharacterized protein n=1 Tax=Fasciola gigantica TaxID=46835 RepID=A0A504YV88_FASGI|nr:hypothetical protein FGIG_08406 [Fasciola gigantica]